MFTEIELKLRLPPDRVSCLLRQPLLKSFTASNPVTRRLYSIYYDTPDLDLRRRGFAFRLRRAGRCWFQTIKGGGAATAGLHLRNESEAQVLKAQPDFTKIGDPPLARLFASTTLRGRLHPLFVTDFSRTTRLLKLPDGSEAELCIDRGKITSDSKNEPVCEIELELRSGRTSALFQLALDLLQSVPFRLENVSKAEQGYALATGSWSPPTKAAPVQLHAEMSADEAFGAISWNCLGHLHGNEAGMLQGRDIEYLHQMRIALRRLRTSLSLFSKLRPGITPGPLVQELKWLSGKFGPARDWDVFVAETVAHVTSHFPGYPGIAELKDRCERRRRHYNHEAECALYSQRYTELMLKLSIWLCTECRNESSVTSGEDAPLDLKPKIFIKGFSRALLENRRRQLGKYGKRLASLDEAELHALRIVLKKHRYAAEFFAGIYSHKKTRRYIQSLSRVQDTLGTLNDAANARQLLSEVSFENDGKDLHEAAGIMLGWSASLGLCDKSQLMNAWVNFVENETFW